MVLERLKFLLVGLSLLIKAMFSVDAEMVSCNISACDLPDTCVCLSPWAWGIHIWQITRAHVTTITYPYTCML